jgi:hypothetical protein
MRQRAEQHPDASLIHNPDVFARGFRKVEQSSLRSVIVSARAKSSNTGRGSWPMRVANV